MCFDGRCLYCDSLHVGMAHLTRMEREPAVSDYTDSQVA